MKGRKSWFVVILVLLIPTFLMGRENQEADKPRAAALRVGIAGSAPFIINDGQELEGISIEVWQSIALKAGWSYAFRQYNTVSDALEALAGGEIDLIVGPTSITAHRAQKVWFSQPYFQSSLSILARTDFPSLWERIGPFFSKKLFVAIGLFLFILSCVGTLLWLAERKASPQQFPHDPPRGIANGMWCAIVTMSTTGYGDIAPVTLIGRIVAGTWMIISIIFATSMVAGIASTLTLTGMKHTVISKAEELRNKKVAVLKNSPATEFVKDFGGKQTVVQNLEEGYQLLKDKQVDALVFDRPQILYFLKNHTEAEVAVSQAEYLKQGYGFVFPLHSENVQEFNIHLLRLRESGDLDQIVREWLGQKEVL